MNNKLKNLLRSALTVFYPQRCPCCEKVISKDKLFCDNCQKEYKGTIYQKYARGGYLSTSAVPYTGVFSKAILNFKFHNRKQYARQLATFIAEAVKRDFSHISFDFITFVPLHKKRFEDRGYNQSELLAKELSALLYIPMEDILIKTRNNQPQHTLKASKRGENVLNAYRVADKNRVKDKCILIIDDIITTGSTLGECAKILQNSGAKEVYCATFAITVVKTT